MKKEVFENDKFNILEDSDYIYAFRALNNGDEADIQNGITCFDNKTIEVIRPDIARYNESGKNSIFTNNDKLSLKEAWRHIRYGHTTDTNAISLTRNSNTVIDYGSGVDHNKRYVLVKVPKNENSNIYNAGLFMLEEIEKKIEKELSKLSLDSEIHKIIQKIDEAKTQNDISENVINVFKRPKTLSNLKSQKKSFESYRRRFSKKAYFSEEQQLEYNKIIAKLTILEVSEKMKPIMNVCPDNASLITSLGSAFASSELLHYGEIKKDEFIEIQEEVIELISLIQQIDDNKKSEELKIKLLEYIKNDYKLNDKDGKVVFGNNENNIEINLNSEEFFDKKEYNEDDISISELYELTDGNIDYNIANNLIEFYTRLAISRKKTLEYIQVLEAIGASDEIIQEIKNKSFIAHSKILSKNQEGIGYKLSESVRIFIDEQNSNILSKEEQLKIIEEVKNLSNQELDDIIKSNGKNIQKSIISKRITENKNINENEYYINAIIDGLNLNKIYGIEKELTKEQKQNILEKLKDINVKNLYEAFKKANIKASDIPNYIINLSMEDGFSNYNLKEFSNLDNLNEIVLKNIKNWNFKITPYYLDKYIGIQDNKNIVEGTAIKLKDYQKSVVDKIEKIYEEKRFAGVVLPTGGGKSFVAMAEMLKHKKDNIIYLAPNQTILAQFKLHIIKNILNIEIVNDENAKNNEKSEKTRLTLEEAEERIKEVFPHLETMCYQSLLEKSDEEIEKLNPQFLVLDELHRTGANKWYPKVNKLINVNQECKILGLTATPERDELSNALLESEQVEDKKLLLDMMRNIAMLTGDYTNEEIIQKKHLAIDLNLLDAMRMGYVVVPKIVGFDYTLSESDEYQTVKRSYEEEKNSEKKKEYANALEKMNAIIENAKKQGMNKIIEENITKKDGKYIIFLPRNSSGLSAEQYIKNELEIFKKDFSKMDENPEAWFLFSDRKDGILNENVLQEFEITKDEHIKLLAAIDMLNEGVHVSDISGCFMKRKISGSRKILYLQQIGRCIYAIDPDNPPKEDEIPVIFDMYNNYLVHDLNREINIGNSRSDLERMNDAVNWVLKHGYFPDINSIAVEEARKAIIFKKIQAKYKKYNEDFDRSNLTKIENFEIDQILELGKIELVNLWEREKIEDRIIPPGEKEIDEVNVVQVSAVQKDFIEIFNNITRKNQNKLTKSMLLKRQLTALKVLADNGIIINNTTIKTDTEFKNLYETLPESEKEYLNEHGIYEDFNLYDGYQNVKKSFYYKNNELYEIFSGYSVAELKKCGVFEEFFNNGEKICIDKNNFIIQGSDQFKFKNINTGQYFDEFGKKYEDYFKKKDEQIDEVDETEKNNAINEFNKFDKNIKIFYFIIKKGITLNHNRIKELKFKKFLETLSIDEKKEFEKLGVDEKFDIQKTYQELQEYLYYWSINANKIKHFVKIDVPVSNFQEMGLYDDFYFEGEVKSFCNENHKIKRGPAVNIGKTNYSITRNFIKKTLDVLKILNKNGYEINNDTIKKDIDFFEIYKKLPQEDIEFLNKSEVFGYFDLYNSYQEAKYYYANNPSVFEQDVYEPVTNKIITVQSEYEKYNFEELKNMRNF